MRVLFSSILFGSLIGFCSVSFAQADFTSQILSSGRYEVRKPADKRPVGRHPSADVTATTTTSSASAKVEVQQSVVIGVSNQSSSTAPATTSPIHAASEAVYLPAKPLPVVEEAPATNEEPDLSTQAKSLLGSEDLKIMEFYQERVHPDDMRFNKIEIQISPGLSNINSKSNYSYRNYQSSYTEIDLRSNVWLTPLIGLTGGIRFAMGASIRGSGATNSADHVKSEKMELGLKFRRFFGLSRKSTSVEFELFYLDDAFNVSTDSVSHLRTRSSGLGLGVHATLPSSVDHAWVLGGSLAPKMKHQESKTALDVSSGSPMETVRIGIDLGGEWRFSRGSQLLYGISATSEKNVFDGPASAIDPDTGVTPSNVTVTNSHVNFSFGYRWGH